jgi:hypothetical protein
LSGQGSPPNVEIRHSPAQRGARGLVVEGASGHVDLLQEIRRDHHASQFWVGRINIQRFSILEILEKGKLAFITVQRIT